MRVCKCVCTYTYIYTYTHAQTNLFQFCREVPIYIFMLIYIHTYMHIWQTDTRIHTHKRIISHTSHLFQFAAKYLRGYNPSSLKRHSNPNTYVKKKLAITPI